MWYRYFLAPPTGPQRKPAVSATLLAGPLGVPLEDYAQSYLAGNQVTMKRDELLQGAAGRSYQFSSPDGATRHFLLLVADAGKVYGLFAQGEAEPFAAQLATLEEMAKSLTLERPAGYPVHSSEKLGFSIRIPPSWRSTRSFSGGGTYLTQFTSPPLGADKNRQTVHASLTVTVEPLSADATLESFYDATRLKLGEAFKLIQHSRWRDGYVDVMRTETPVTVSRVKRFYRVDGSRAYTVACEARDDVYHRVSRWCDMIAATLTTGPEVTRK
jgi:hypothetical protein